MKKSLSVWVLASLIVGTIFMPLSAEASHCWRDKHGRKHCDQGQHRGWNKNDWRQREYRNGSLINWRTQKILKGGLVGAGIGAGAGVLLNKPVGRTAILGTGIGAGTQAVRYSRTMNRHPIVKTAAYGALAGAGASQLTREGSIKKGTLWGAAIGTGVGALRHMD